MENTPKNQYSSVWDEKNKIGRVYIAGEVDLEMTEELIKLGHITQEKYGGEKGQVDWLVDVTKITKPSVILPIRKVMSEGIKLFGAGKIAVVGTSKFIETIMVFIMGVSGERKFSYFKSEEEALKWLKKK
jgi:hypothetical protein